jgi:hypothetical protein
MNGGRLIRFLGGLFAIGVAVTAFAILDWYPTIKDLGRLRRERSDLARNILNHEAITSRFEFPGVHENSLLDGAEGNARGAVPEFSGDRDWLASAIAELREGIGGEGAPDSAVLFFSPAPEASLQAVSLGQRSSFGEWALGRQTAAIREAFAAASAASHSPWHRLLFDLNLPEQHQPAIRTVGIAMEGPLPELLNRINRVSWGRLRLELVRLYLEPGSTGGRAWLVCRGNYRAAETSAWLLQNPGAEQDDDPLVDSDSPLLLRSVDASICPQPKKQELAEAAIVSR